MKRILWVVVLIFIALYFWRLGSIPLFDPDEGRYAEIPREMLVTDDLVTPRLIGLFYFEKPPLYYWLNTAAMWAFGVNEFANRFWNTMFGLAGVFLTYSLGKKMAGRNVAVVAAIALGTSPLWAGLSRLNSLDMTLTFFTTATLAGFWFAMDAPAGWRRFLFWHGAFAAAACAVLTKGLIGLVIPAAVAGLFVLSTGRWRIFKDVPWLSGMILFLAIAAPWHILIAHRNPDWAWFYFVHEHWLRYTTSVAQREEPFWFFFAVIGLGCAPWTGMFPTIARRFSPRRFRELRANHQDTLFLAIWFAFVFLFFSASHSKLIPYMLPALPPLAILVAKAWEELRTRELPIGRVEKVSLTLGVFGTLLFAATYAVLGAGVITSFGLENTVSPVFLVLAAALIGLGVASIFIARQRQLQVLAVIAGAISSLAFVGVLIIAPSMAAEKSAKEAARIIKPLLQPSDEVYSYRDFAETLPFYLERNVGVIISRGELTFGIDHLEEDQQKRRFPTVEDIPSMWNGKNRVFVLTPKRHRKWLAQDGLAGGHVVWENPYWTWISNQPQNLAPIQNR